MHVSALAYDIEEMRRADGDRDVRKIERDIREIAASG
jgi:hypothetical protein